MKIVVLAILILSTTFSLIASSDGTFDAEKSAERDRLDRAKADALRRIELAPESKAGDYLRLLPSVSVSRSSPIGEVKEAETYLGASISVNSLFDINDAAVSRKKAKRAGLRKIDLVSQQISTLINRKFILKRKIWQKSQIRKSLTNPLEIAQFDDTIDDFSIKVEEIDEKIESLFAEMELICIGVEE